MNPTSLIEEHLKSFDAINLSEFFINMVIAALLATLVRVFFVRFGNSITNRHRFASNFMPLALTTMLIITIVKSSIALSLGLVGALSIVRFRAAIKDPEELTYLFIVIGIGLGTGASQASITVMATVLILVFLILSKQLEGKVSFKSEDKLYVNISTDVNDLKRINKILTEVFPYVELKRLDTLGKGLDISYICKAKNIEQISDAKDRLTELSPSTTVSFVDQPDLII